MLEFMENFKVAKNVVFFFFNPFFFYFVFVIIICQALEQNSDLAHF